MINASLDKPRPPMFFIEGYEDANVDPQHSEGYLEAVKATGVPLHIWYGQWVHAYPQPTAVSCDELAPCRGDFFEVALLAWFDQFLRGRDTGILDAPMVQTQADDGVWRHEDAWPPTEIQAVGLYPTAAGGFADAASTGHVSYTDDTVSAQPGTRVEFVSEPFAENLRLTGMPLLETLATANAPQAGLVATLLERFPDGSQRYLNFAAQSLNHAQDLGHGNADISGKAIPVAVNFFTQDNMVSTGSRLVLSIGGVVAPAGVPVGSNSANFLTGGPNLMPVGLGANVQLELVNTRLTLRVNPGNRVEPLSWVKQ